MSMCLRDAPAQWTDATRKNYYGKYSTRSLLLFNLIINMAFLPVVFGYEDRPYRVFFVLTVDFQ